MSDGTAVVDATPAEAGEAEVATTEVDSRWRRVRAALGRGVHLVAGPAVALVVILVVWHVALVWTDTETFIFPKPLEVFEAGWEKRDLLLESVWRTVQAAVLGFLLAVVGGILAAVVLHSSRLLERSLLPYAVLLQTTPVVAVAPVIVIWVGAGLQAIITVGFIISFFPMLSNTLVGLHSVDAERESLFRLYHTTRLQRLWKLEFPTALPFILAGARISAGLSVIGVIVGEFVAGIGGGRGGLGYVITVSARQLDTAYLFAAAFAGSLVGIGFYAVVGRITKLLLGSWHESQVGEARELRPAG